jgi:hypothetical protein
MRTIFFIIAFVFSVLLSASSAISQDRNISSEQDITNTNCPVTGKPVNPVITAKLDEKIGSSLFCVGSIA